MNQLNIFIADDKKAICDSIEDNIYSEMKIFNGYDQSKLQIKKAFTDHAYKHGKNLINEGFIPNICIFDLVFNGDTGVDLYKFIKERLTSHKIYLCIYTGTEQAYKKRQEAEVLASQYEGLVAIIQKPNINTLLDWFSDIIVKEYKMEKIYEENDPFSLL